MNLLICKGGIEDFFCFFFKVYKRGVSIGGVFYVHNSVCPYSLGKAQGGMY